MDIKIYSNNLPDEIAAQIQQNEVCFLDLEESLHMEELPKSLDRNQLVYNYVHYVQAKKVIRIPIQEQFRAIRLDRNRNLITQDEQTTLLAATIGIAGMSVGYYALTCMALEGIGGFFKLSDGDHISLSNMNRIPASLFDIGRSKNAFAKQAALEIDPYLRILDSNSGLHEDDLDAFFSDPLLDIFIDEMDDLRMKVLVRMYAKKYGVPVIMVTGNNESVILDVERYDLNKDQQLFNGTVEDAVIETILNATDEKYIDPAVFSQLALQLVGEDVVDATLLNSFELVGTELNGIPQLAETSYRRGFVLTTVTKRILLGARVESGRYLYNCEPIEG